jgi:hypothetical protein
MGDFADALGSTLDLVNQLGEAVPSMGENFNIVKGALAPITIALDFTNKELGFLKGLLPDTADGADVLTDSLSRTASGVVLLDDAATHVDPQITAMQESLKGLEDATQTAGDGILSLTGTVKETFNISQKEMDKGFEQMLRSAVRFEHDIQALGKIDVGLSPQQETKFEQFLISEGPGFVDRFVQSSKAKQNEWVAEWQRSIDSVKGSLRSIDNIVISPRVDLSAAQQQVSTLEGRLARLGGI